MDFPEIRNHVAQYLDNASLAKLAIVCKSWNATFIPFLYSRMEWSRSSDSSNCPPEELIKAHAHHFRVVDLRNDVAFSMDAMTRIEDLKLNFSYDSLLWTKLVSLIIRNPRLRRLEVDLSYCGSPLKIMEAISRCQNLRKLKFRIKDLDNKIIELLFNTCTYLQELELDFIESAEIDYMDKWIEFPEIRKLRIDSRSTSTSHTQLEFIQRCPQLRSLILTTETIDFPTPDVFKVFSKIGPQLKELGLYIFRDLPLQGDDLVRILDTCTSLTSFTMFQACLIPTAFHWLRLRFGSLTKLTVLESPGCTSSMAQEIMMSCPLLESLHLPRLEARDILGVVQNKELNEGGDNGQMDIHPSEWVCLRLKFLSVYICGLGGQSVEWQRLVFQQLARLERLEKLNLGSRFLWNQYIGDCLVLRVDNGLDILASLRRLSDIWFSNTKQTMEEVDIRWMIQAWPNLKMVRGILHSDATLALGLEAIFREHGVTISYM